MPLTTVVRGCVAIALAILMALAVSAPGVRATDRNPAGLQDQRPVEVRPLIRVAHDRVFLGCVSDNHECSHLAQGFEHYTVIHDHSCGEHPHLACYGFND